MNIMTIPIAAIHVGQRQRSEVPEQHIKDLAADILSNGLIHAISIDKNDELVAGFCRLQAIATLNQPYFYAGAEIQPGYIPVARVHFNDERILFRIELMENLCRRNLSPVDQAKAVTRLHEMFQAEHGPDWSKSDTGHELDAFRSASRTSMPGSERTDTGARNEVADSILIAGFADDPDVAKAKSRSEAVKIAKRKLEQELMGGLGALQNLATKDFQIFQGKCEDVLPTLPDRSFHGIVCDPPYGIEADSFGEQTMAGGGHKYEDDEASAIARVDSIVSHGHRLCADDAHLYLFCDIRLWPTLREIVRSRGWMPYATPLIWVKQGMGHAPQPGYFTRRYECILFAQKGNRRLSHSRSDVFDYPAVKEKLHAAQKPVDLVAELLALSLFPGEHVLDPCAGSGTIFTAAKKAKVKATGIELEEMNVNFCRQAIAGEN